MAISITLKEYLDQSDVNYDVLPHPYSSSSMQTAQAAHVPGQQIAKAVLLEDDDGYLLAVVPATHRVELGILRRQLNRELWLASEGELADLFHDCALGAVPPLGRAYGFDMVVDDCLTDCSEVYFEAGDHMELVHVDGRSFNTLMAEAETGRFSRHV